MSGKDQILEKLSAIIDDKLGFTKDEVTLESKITEDLGADSLDKVELIMEVEKEFDVTIEDEKVENVETVGDIVNLLLELGK